MAISARYEQYDINSAGKRLTTQSIVECRLNDWSENKILAVNASVALTGAEVVSGEIRYGGKIYFSVLAATPEGAIAGAERAAEFSHKCVAEEAAPALSHSLRDRVRFGAVGLIHAHQRPVGRRRHRRQDGGYARAPHRRVFRKRRSGGGIRNRLRGRHTLPFGERLRDARRVRERYDRRGGRDRTGHSGKARGGKGTRFLRAAHSVPNADLRSIFPPTATRTKTNAPSSPRSRWRSAAKYILPSNFRCARTRSALPANAPSNARA